MRRIDLSNVEEAKNGGNRLPAGGYIAKYVKVTDVTDKEYLQFEYDIAEGEFANHFAELEKNLGFWGGRYIRSYKQSALPFFKRMCSAVTKSNSGYIFDGNTNADERTLVGKRVGLILGEEEYVGNDGSTKTRLYVVRECDIETINSGDYKIPALKKLAVEPGNEDFMQISDGAEETPFN